MKTILRAMWITFIGTRSSMVGHAEWRIGPIQAFMRLCDAESMQRSGVAMAFLILQQVSDSIDAVPFGHRILRAPQSPYVEGSLDGLV